MKTETKRKWSLARALTVVLFLALAACKESNGVVSFGDSTPSPLPISVPVDIIIHTGTGFECFTIGHRIFCAGHSTDHDIGLNTTSYILYVNDTDSDFTGFKTWDNTICWTSAVQMRPFSRTPGVATSCIGVATLQNTNSEPMVYGGPIYSDLANGSPDLIPYNLPMVGSDFSMTDFIAGNYVTDTTADVTSTLTTCQLLQDSMILSCQGFSVQL